MYAIRPQLNRARGLHNKSLEHSGLEFGPLDPLPVPIFVGRSDAGRVLNYMLSSPMQLGAAIKVHTPYLKSVPVY